MTVINPNSVAGINSITVQSGNALSVHKSDGTLIQTIVSSTGISTFSSVSVGSATTTNNADKSINIGLGASISQHANNTLSLGTGGAEKARIDSSGRLYLGATTGGNADTDDLVINGSGKKGITICSTDGSESRLTFADGLSGVNAVAGNITYTHSNDSLDFYTATTRRLRINSSGDVGIGTDTMNAPLTVVNHDSAGYIASFRQKHASNSAQIIIDSPSDSNVRPASIDLAQAGTVKWSLGQAYSSTSSQAFHIATSTLQANENGSKLIITTSGNTGIGTINPSKTLTIFGASSSSFRISKSGVLAYDHTFDGSTYTIANNNGSAGIPILIGTKTAGGESVRITSGGKVGIGFTFNYTMNSSSTDLVIGDGGGGRGITLWTASGADNQTISFQTNETLSRAEGEISYGPTGTTTTADRNAMMFRTNSGERMRIDSGGRVLIGTTSSISDNQELQVVASGGVPGSIGLARNDTTVSNGAQLGQIIAYGNDSDGSYQEVAGIKFSAGLNHGNNDKPGRITFETTPDGGSSVQERLRLTHEGILTNSNSNNAPTSGSGWGFTSDQLYLSTNGTSANYALRFYNDNGLVGSVLVNASGVAFNTSSDYRLKENQVSISDGITRLKQLKPYRFNFKADASTTVDGFLAHEAQSVVPEAVTGTKDEVETIYYKEGDTIPEGKVAGDVKDAASAVYQGIDQSKLVPLLTAALQEAVAKIETLETKVAALEGG